MAGGAKKPSQFTFRYAQRVRVRPAHPDAGATGEVLNAYLYPDGFEIVFVSVPGGEGRYRAADLEPLPEGNGSTAPD
ncbi:MAG TPA: hypothetical protein VFA07_03175 [Chthonomonadaceae bacterium]|nr:hypothetical protein [Chthonomonadaceae bacterium]